MSHPIIDITHNDRSRRVIEKCGFDYLKNRPFFAKKLGQGICIHRNADLS